MSRRRFLGGTLNEYKEYNEGTFDGIERIDSEEYETREIECKCVTKHAMQFHKRQPPADYSEVIEVFMLFKPFKGSETRKPDEIFHADNWYIFYAHEEPGVVMKHYIALAYLPTSVPYG